MGQWWPGTNTRRGYVKREKVRGMGTYNCHKIGSIRNPQDIAS